MAENPYFSWSREDLREEIKREKEQREDLRREISRLREEIRQLRPLTRGYFLFDGREISEEAYNLARTTSYLSGPRFDTSYRRLGYLVDNPGALIYAARYQPSRIETVRAEIEEAPQRAMREDEIDRIQDQISAIDAELEQKDEAMKRPRYVKVEYCRYYKYLSSDPGKRRHFEARGTFTVPGDVDPLGDNAITVAADILDNGVIGLGIEIDDSWDVGWCKTGAEITDETSANFNGSVEVTVYDLQRSGKGPWKTHVPVSESDFRR